MTRPSILSSCVLGGLLLSSPAFAQSATPATTTPPEAPPETGSSSVTAPPTNYSAPATPIETDDYKRFGFTAEAQMLVPVGDLSEGSGLLLGPTVRFGYRVARPVQLTASAGYLFGLTKDTNTGPIQGNGGLNLVPLMVGGRFFFFPDAEKDSEANRERGAASGYSGLYLHTEIGLNLIIPKAEIAGKSVENLDTRPRFGGNFGLGYIISKRLPIDVRAQFSLLNLFGKEDQVEGAQIDEKTLYGIGISAGYTLQF